MTNTAPRNRVRQLRTARGLTQAQLAELAGISRTAVTAIEGSQLVPSVLAALALAKVLECTVEELFLEPSDSLPGETWAWPSPTEQSVSKCWKAEVDGRVLLYPAVVAPMLTLLPEALAESPIPPDQTLVLAGCDPAAGLLATHFAQQTRQRLLVIPRSSAQSLELLRNGLVHLAGLHYSTSADPDHNTRIVREKLGAGYSLVRLARWQEGIVLGSGTGLRSVRQAVRAKLTWVGREPGSGARQCLDQLLPRQATPRHVARNHQGVVEAIQSGWADAGVCVQLAGVEAGLAFLPVREEFYDLCFPTRFAEDRRFKAFLKVIRARPYQRILSELPGYDAGETGDFLEKT